VKLTVTFPPEGPVTDGAVVENVVYGEAEAEWEQRVVARSIAGVGSGELVEELRLVTERGARGCSAQVS